jgi:hypothetical protein
MQNSVFMVNTEPYCVWEVDLQERNNDFLDGIDVEYYGYILKSHIDCDDRDDKRAVIAIRNAYYHAMETMYSLFGAFLQAPYCTYAWIGKYKTSDLREIVKKINSGSTSLETIVKIDELSWERIAELVFSYYDPKPEEKQKTIERFSRFWRLISSEFLNKDYIDEYNSIKHGFRVKSGGFGISVGIQNEHGVPAPEENMAVIGNSEHGSSFYKLSPVGGSPKNRSIKSSQMSLNWTIEKTAILIQLVEFSIGNLVSILKIMNGAKPSETKIHLPEDPSCFEKAWQFNSTLNSSSFDFVLDEDKIPSLSKAELLKKYSEQRSC